MNTRTLVVAVAAALLLPLAAGAQPVFSGFETRVTLHPGDQYDPSIAGDLVVFTDYRSANTDVYYVNLATMTEAPVVVAPGNQELTGVSDGIIVYTDYRTADVAAFTVADGLTVNLTAEDKAALGRPFHSLDPAISGNLVAWEDDRDGNLEIYAKDLATNEERRITNAPEVDEKPSVSGSRIVWQRCTVEGCDIWMYDWATQALTQITDTRDDERQPNIDGNLVVYQALRGTDQDIFLHDLATGTEKRLSLPGDQANPHVSGDYVALDDLSAGVYHIKLWHHASGEVFQVTSGTSGQYLNDIDGNRVVYTDDRNGNLDIYMYTFQVEWPPSSGGEVCRSVSLEASRSYNPARWHDAYQVLTPSMRFALPAELPVTSGNAGKHHATLSFGDGWHQTWCFYRGGAHHPHPVGAEAELGLKYVLQWCTGGVQAGDEVTADRIWLHLGGGDNHAGTTVVQLTLPEIGPCVGAVPPDCDHLENAAPILDVTFHARLHWWLNDKVFLATPMEALVCIDNGPGGTAVNGGTLKLNQDVIVASNAWQQRIELRADLKSLNYLSAQMLTPQQGSVRVRVFAGPVIDTPPPCGKRNWHQVGWEQLAEMGGEASGSSEAAGCTQSGGGLAPFAVLFLLVLAVIPRRAVARVRGGAR